jgi:hypothetical protein
MTSVAAKRIRRNIQNGELVLFRHPDGRRKLVRAREFERAESRFHEDALFFGAAADDGDDRTAKHVRKPARVKGLPADLITTKQLLKESGVSASTLGRLTRRGVVAPSTYVVKSGGRGRPEKTWPREEALTAIANAVGSP